MTKPREGSSSSRARTVRADEACMYTSARREWPTSCPSCATLFRTMLLLSDLCGAERMFNCGSTTLTRIDKFVNLTFEFEWIQRFRFNVWESCVFLWLSAWHDFYCHFYCLFFVLISFLVILLWKKKECFFSFSNYHSLEEEVLPILFFGKSVDEYLKYSHN